MSEIVWKHYLFNEINPKLLYRILKLRQDIFIIEQFCPYDDIDNKDEKAIHICGYIDNDLIAYARIFKKGDYYDDYASIGRIVIDPDHRGKKIGFDLINNSIQLVKDNAIQIEAQCYLASFYGLFGFEVIGKPYSLDGILHYKMIKK